MKMSLQTSLFRRNSTSEASRMSCRAGPGRNRSGLVEMIGATSVPLARETGKKSAANAKVTFAFLLDQRKAHRGHGGPDSHQ